MLCSPAARVAGPARAGLPDGCVVNGEVVIWTDDRLDFDALQRRLAAGRAPKSIRNRATDSDEKY